MTACRDIRNPGQHEIAIGALNHRGVMACPIIRRTNGGDINIRVPEHIVSGIIGSLGQMLHLQAKIDRRILAIQIIDGDVAADRPGGDPAFIAGAVTGIARLGNRCGQIAVIIGTVAIRIRAVRAQRPGHRCIIRAGDGDGYIVGGRYGA